MSRKSEFPDAFDVREVVTPAQLAEQTGVDEQVAATIVDAHLYATVALAASGSVVVLFSGRVDGTYEPAVRSYIEQHYHELLGGLDDHVSLAEVVHRSVPAAYRAPRVDPVTEAEVIPLTHALAAQRVGAISEDQVVGVLGAWWEATSKLNASDFSKPIVVRRAWDVSERDFENWLESHLDCLFQRKTALVARQHRLMNGRIADLVVEIVDPAQPLFEGRRIVVENKAGEDTIEAVEQVAAYADTLDADGRKDEVICVLAATSFAAPTEAVAASRGVITKT